MSYRSLLTSMCTIQAPSTSVNALGQVVHTFSTGTQYRCRINPLRADGERDQAARPLVENRYRVYFEADAPVTEHVRILNAGQTYNPVAVNDYFGHHYEVEAERID